ncbi:LAGLIDADG family homing endonuclease [Candidatus Hodarchaeum mangrovi]
MGLSFDVRGRFESFINQFENEQGELKYREMIREMEPRGLRSFEISYNDLLIFDPDLALGILSYPEETLQIGVEVLRLILMQISPSYVEKLIQLHVRIIDLTEKIKLRSLKTEHLGLLTNFEGIVIGVTEATPLLIRGVFKCAACGEDNQIVDFPEGIFLPPYQCMNEQCQRKGSLQLQLERSIFIDWQKLTLQEKPEELPPGQLPQSITIHIIDDLVDTARPGDRVQVVGVLKARASRLLKRGQLATYTKFFQGISISKETKEYVDIEISEEDELKIIDLSKSPYVIEKIRDSLAPSIYGFDSVKEAIATLLFGGSSKETPDGVKLRGELNILLIGDPGVGKSQLLKFVANLAPRALYTSGKGSTAAGLTAAVIRDQDTGEITLEAGALVLADQGIAMVDEFDKMRPEDRTAIHEAMEQHSYHPSFEISLSNGLKTPIGAYVDNLLAKDTEKTINGVNCEILPLDHLEESLYSCDFNQFFHQKITQVSRHEAPDSFVRLTYSNGRDILVTPEHPIFIFHGEHIDEIPADEIQVDSFVPSPRIIHFSNKQIKLEKNIDPGRKETNLPTSLTESLARFLGYYVTEGYSCEGSTMEVGLSNTKAKIIQDMKKVIRETFHIIPIDNTKNNRILRIISKSVYNYLHYNFPNLMKKSLERRIPSLLFSSDRNCRIAFLNAAFHGDGSIETESCVYSTSSKGLAQDYQDLLLSLGIHTRIVSSDYLTIMGKESRVRYKVYIRGDHLSRFVKIIIPDLRNNEKLKLLVQRSKRKYRSYDVLPSGTGRIIKECMKRLGLPYNGYFQQYLNGNYGITIKVIDKYLEALKERIFVLENIIPDISDLRQFRETIGYSQAQLARMIGEKRGIIDYVENGGYILQYRTSVLDVSRIVFHEILSDVKKSISYIEKLKQFRWLRIKKVERIPNADKNKTDWVYDVTVNPTRTFVSHGLILHNTISIAKAGIVATLNARTSILAAANPRRGRWNPYKGTADNLNLPATILSRFDLIFVLEDRPDEKEDHDKASHILTLHKSRVLPVSPPIEHNLLRKYIAYARREVKPRLSDQAQERLLEYYKKLRRESGTIDEKGPDPIAITPRQLEALIRLSEARAKMRLSDEVSYDDASGAINLMESTLEKLAKDAETGKFDIDKYSSDVSAGSRRKLDRIEALIDKLLEEADDEPVAKKMIVDKAVEADMDRQDVIRTIDEMVRRGVLFEPQSGHVKRP